MAEQLIGRDAPTHRRWDVDVEPVLHVDPGDVIVVPTDDFAAVGRSRHRPQLAQ
jgi:acetamidase/formamidase